jgi:hypothetical protein
MHMHEHVPHVSLHPNDISVLEHVVRGYLAFLRNGVPPSKKCDVQIQTLQRLQQRLTTITSAHAENTCFPLTADDIQALDAAFRGFITLVRRMVPVSQERDETLLDVENLRQQLAKMITPLS